MRNHALLLLLAAAYACDDGSCPMSAPATRDSCSGDLTCRYGTETCCGETHASLVCSCASGEWNCYYTDACLIPECPDADAGPDDGGGPTEVSCGAMTCGADEYCFIECTCCGFPTDAAPSAREECRPIPPGCETSLCTCPEIPRGDACDAENRTIQLLCA